MGTWRGRRGNPSRTCPFPLQGSSAPGAPPSTRSPSVSPPSLCRGHLLCAGTLSGGAGAVGSTHPGGDMGTMSPKSSSPCDSRGLQNMMDEPPLERGQSPSCPAVGEGAAGGDVGPLGGVTQVTKHRAWTGALVPAVTPLWVSPCPRHPRSFPRAHPAPAPAPPSRLLHQVTRARCGPDVAGGARPSPHGLPRATCSARCALGRVTAKCGGCSHGPPVLPQARGGAARFASPRGD